MLNVTFVLKIAMSFQNVNAECDQSDIDYNFVFFETITGISCLFEVLRMRSSRDMFMDMKQHFLQTLESPCPRVGEACFGCRTSAASVAQCSAQPDSSLIL